MRLFWLQQLPLLVLIQLLEPSRLSHKIYAEALFAFKSTGCNPRQFSGRVGRYPCVRQWACVNCHKLKDLGVVFPAIRPLSRQTKVINFPPSIPTSSPSHTSTRLLAKFYKSRKTRTAATVDGDIGVPTLTPLQAAHAKKPRKRAAIVGGVGASLLVVIIGVLVYICLMRVKRFIRRTSETASSVPSPAEWERGSISPGTGVLSPYDTQTLRHFTIFELEHATCSFSQSNIIGEGGFGLVYKGLLQDGSIVAIKRRLHNPTRSFVHEVKHIARVHHKHLVKIIGYCEENHQQLLVYDYLPNGNVGNHLYDSEGLPIGKLEMQQRLLIALGAAKGLEHLHGLVPPLLHMHFRTSNVLMDDNFTTKVSDFGLPKLLVEGNRAGSSSAIDCFLDPEIRSSKDFSERSDVYSFGVFLLELISGREALGRNQFEPQQNLVLQAKGILDLGIFVDKTLGDHTMQAVKQMMELALLCVDTGLRRPTMKSVVEELEKIQGREISHLHYELGEEIGDVTLGSELFK